MKVFINGTFDILHIGHVKILNFAKEQGNYLTVGIDSDDRVKRLKGEGRPINNQEERKEFLLNLRAVDDVVIFSADDELKTFLRQSDVYVIGSDYLTKPIIGRDLCKKLVFFERIDGHSTTQKIQSLTNW
jgi:D-beta-D-heptose 7-phosphate kinase/D-beta-D-heptose 1-phosphate adenosyltransferase